MVAKRLGVGATVRVLVSRLHPKNLIKKAYPNATKDEKAENLLVASKSMRLIRRQDKEVIVLRHQPKGDQAEPFDCWALERFVHVIEEGHADDFFALPGGEAAAAGGGEEEAIAEIVEEIVPEELNRFLDPRDSEGCPAAVDVDDLDLLRSMLDPEQIDDKEGECISSKRKFTEHSILKKS